MSKKITGAIWENKSNNPKAPSGKGFIEIDGEKIEIVIWKKISKAGQPYQSISNNERTEKT